MTKITFLSIILLVLLIVIVVGAYIQLNFDQRTPIIERVRVECARLDYTEFEIDWKNERGYCVRVVTGYEYSFPFDYLEEKYNGP